MSSSGLLSRVSVSDLDDRSAVVSRSDFRGVIVSRDIEAVRLVLEMGVVTALQAYRLIWWNKDSKGSRYAEERMLFLERAQFLTRVQTPYSKRLFYKGTRQGLELVQSTDPRFCLTTREPMTYSLLISAITAARVKRA